MKQAKSVNIIICITIFILYFLFRINYIMLSAGLSEIDFKILAIDSYTTIVEWYLEQNSEIYDGIYEIKFNENLECIYFKSWEMKDVFN